jgi:hypothetical protein
MILTVLLFYPVFCLAELPDSENRPFWTQKTCYIEDEMVYGVGVAMEEKSLEKARKKSFEAARLEIANFAQLKETTLLVIETQMTYEEMGKDASFSVWRLVKIPYQMLKRAKTVMKRNKPFYRELVSHITSLEKNRKNELADDLRRAVASGIEKSELKIFFQSGSTSPIKNIDSKKDFGDRILPTGSIVGMNPYFMPDEIINLKIIAEDNEKLKAIFFSIDNSRIMKKWHLNAEIFERNYSLSTKSLSLGEHRYTFKVVDTSGNSFINKGTFQITDLHNELRRLFLEEFEE